MRIVGPVLPLQRLLATALPKAARMAADMVQPNLAPAAASMAAAQSTTSVQMLVALAAIDPAVQRRRQVAAAADKGLRALERLHAELATGQPGVARLREIAEWSHALNVPDDIPGDDTAAARQILKDVELRVLVELAKHETRI
jgi:hypothetical protein